MPRDQYRDSEGREHESIGDAEGEREGTSWSTKSA